MPGCGHVQAVTRTSDRSESASVDDPAERGCSRLRTTLGSTPTMPGGSHMTASLGGRYDPWLVIVPVSESDLGHSGLPPGAT